MESSIEMEFILAAYMCAKIKCTILGKSYLCAKYMSHPVFGSFESNGSGVGVVVQSSTNFGPFVVQHIEIDGGNVF